MYNGSKTMKKAMLLLMVTSLCGCSEDPDRICIEGTCYDVLSQASSYLPASVDILFVIDNSGSMVGEQRQLAESFSRFASVLDERFRDYHIAIITTGMQSGNCPPCTSTVTGSCMNETGENGRFQDRRGWNEGTDEIPEFQFENPDPTCRVVSRDNKDCFYDESTQKGTVLVGINGCGFERGLAAMKTALSDDLLDDYNSDFLRDDAMLAVVVISDEDDCGEVGDVTEGVQGAMGDICYYAAKGVGPEGESVHPNDPNAQPYGLTPVEDSYDFLTGLKGKRPGMIKFTAITGVKDVNDLSTTTIEYELGTNDRWDISHACSTPGCTSPYCFAEPGTRYIALARALGLGIHGQVDTICQNDFSDTMEWVAGFMACQEKFPLDKPLAETTNSYVVVNDKLLPPYTCSTQDQIVACQGPEDASCQQGMCVPSWTYQATGESGAEGGTITFAEHLLPCDLVSPGKIEIAVVTEQD